MNTSIKTTNDTHAMIGTDAANLYTGKSYKKAPELATTVSMRGAWSLC
jgi:hypothetical protein